MSNLAIYRIIQGIVFICVIWPEMRDYYNIFISNTELPDDRKLAQMLFMEHLGKIGYAIIAFTIFAITIYSGEWEIFNIPAGWIYVFAEIILFTPVIVRRLSK